jgi:hypothetical protein
VERAHSHESSEPDRNTVMRNQDSQYDGSKSKISQRKRPDMSHSNLSNIETLKQSEKPFCSGRRSAEKDSVLLRGAAPTFTAFEMRKSMQILEASTENLFQPQPGVLSPDRTEKSVEGSHVAALLSHQVLDPKSISVSEEIRAK